MTSVRILAPAKINLGLAIMGKRPDGYHDIDTIMAMIDLCDEITIRPSAVSGISIIGMDGIPTESNLMTKALQLWCEESYVQPNWQIAIEKRIPGPAGIGGGSSDAAAVLRAMNALHGEPLSHDQLHVIAGEIGADCPFFLGAPCARATGIGTDLRSLPPPQGFVVLAVPPAKAAAKTSSLYGALTAEDFGSIEEIDAIEGEMMESGVPHRMLPNGFINPARSILEGLPDIEATICEVTEFCSLSGSGPALYAVADTQAIADTWGQHLRAEFSDEVQVFVAPFLSAPPVPELLP